MSTDLLESGHARIADKIDLKSPKKVKELKKFKRSKV